MAKFGPKKGAEALAAVLPGLSRDNGWQRKLKLHSVFDHWTVIVDEDVAKHAEPLKIVQNVLWVEVENSAWIQQLQYQKLIILDALNEFLQDVQLEDIRLVIKDERKVEKHEGPSVRFVSPPADEIAAFEDQAATIKDEDAREALVRFWYLCHACKRD